MRTIRLWYTPTAEVCFAPNEVEYLIERAKRHYDSACQAAGTSCEDGGSENGFIAQLKLFRGGKAVWTSRQLDLTLKVLEHYAGPNEPIRASLFQDVLSAFNQIQAKHKELNGA